VDPLAGAVVAFFILRTGLSILRETNRQPHGYRPGQSLNDQIRDLVLSVQGVKDVDHVLAHRFWPIVRH